ncbi:aspartate/glutamate racemase family protein [Acuticoccus sp. M5D2P5]|nr:aspartate/glutamate racemase family protein [Acuticoccus kalidii]MCF3933524.1 aspartate/glutamate racemase family protein [Acuticoccus kalidii]
MLTPSSNTVLEPMTAAMLSALPDVTAHFGRFRVVEISLREAALGQFEMEPMLAAAELLADAHVGSIAWNGTSAGWLGFERDRALCAAIEARTGIEATSAILALNEILALTGAKTIGLVSPYIDEVQDRIIANYAKIGIACVADRRLGISENYAFANSTEAEVADLCRDVATAGPDAIVIYCTNMRGAPIAETIEAETGIPVYDTVATSIWGTMRQCGADPARIEGWGRLFRTVS